MSPEALNAIHAMLDTANQPIVRRDTSLVGGGIFGQTGETVLGYPVATTSQMTQAAVGTAGSVLFGNFDDLLILGWGGIMLDASKDAGDSFAKNQTQIRALAYRDIMVRHAESFCLNS